VDWIGLAQDRYRWRALVNSILNLRVPWNAGKLSSGPTTDGVLSSAQLHTVSKVKVKLSRNRPWRPIGLWDVKDPTLSRQSAHRWR
jgi:hypothetical protein